VAFNSIEIENFQRISKRINIDLGPVTVLVGGNSSGKSSVLKAIQWALRCAVLRDDKNKLTLEQMDFVPSRDIFHLGNKLRLQNNTYGRKTNVYFN
jgi:predicted ATP-dependent endonuclease of OLD family